MAAAVRPGQRAQRLQDRQNQMIPRPGAIIVRFGLLIVAASVLTLACTPNGQVPVAPPAATATSLPSAVKSPDETSTPSPTQTPQNIPTPTSTAPTAVVTRVTTAEPFPATPTSVPVDEPGGRGGTLNLASRQAITHYDVQADVSPALSTWGPGIVYSRLMRFTSGPDVALPNLQVECDLCSSWTMLNDTTIEFKIREDAVWQDIDPVNGRPVVASDVAFSYLRQQQSQSPNAALLHMLDRVDVIDSNTLRLDLKAPDADFMVSLADGHSKIVAPEALSISGDLTNGPTVGSGPWILTDSRPSTRHFFESNPDYYEDGYPLLDRLNIHVLQDAATRNAAFQVRNIDVHQMSPAQWQDYSSRVTDAPFLRSQDQGTGLEIAMNAGSEPFQDARLRRAAMLSLDPWGAVEDIWLGAATVGQGVPSPAADWLLTEADLRMYFDDASRARTLIAESGRELPIPVTIKVGDFGDAYLDHAARIADEMEAVGFQPEIEIVNRRYFGEQVWLGGDYQMFVGPMAPVLSPNAYLLSVLHSAGQWNTTGVFDAELDALIESQAQEFDAAKRKELFLEVQRRAMVDSHRFLAAGGVSLWTWWPRVRGFYPNFAGFEYSHWSRVSVR